MRNIIVLIFLLTSLLSAKEFVLKTISGKMLHFEVTPLSLKVKEFPNKVILLDFFGANCPPCIAEMPDLVKIQNLFGKTVQVIGIQATSKRDDNAMRKFVQKHHLDYPVINLEEGTMLISYAQVQTDWNGALPYKLLYDFDGSLSYRLYGKMTEEKLLEVLQNL